MEGLGTYLKQGRREAGLSLEDLAGRTRIRIENLERLEREAMDDLPNELYVRGFVKLVCQELGLSPQEGLARYESLMVTHNDPRDEIVWTGAREAEDTSTLERALRNPERVIGTAKWVAVGIGALLALLLLVWGGRSVAGWWQARSESTVAAVAPAEVARTEAKLPEGTPAETRGGAANDEIIASESSEAEAPADGENSVPVDDRPVAATGRGATGPVEPEPAPIDLALADVDVSLPAAGIQPDLSLAGTLSAATIGSPATEAADPPAETPAETVDGNPTPTDAAPPAGDEPSRPTLALTKTSPEVFRGDPAVRPDESLAALLRPDPTPVPVVGGDDVAATRGNTVATEGDADAVVTTETLGEQERGLVASSSRETPVGTPAETSAPAEPVPSRTAPPRERIEEAKSAEIPAESDPDLVVATPTPKPVPAEPVVVRSSRGGRARLEIEALRAVDVEVLLDGIGFPRKRALSAGERKRYFAEDRFVLTATDAGAVRVWLDGQEISGLGRDGTRLNAREIRRR